MYKSLSDKTLKIEFFKVLSLWILFCFAAFSLSGATLGIVLLYLFSLYAWLKAKHSLSTLFYLWLAFIASSIFSNLWAQAEFNLTLKELQQVWLVLLPFAISVFFSGSKRSILPFLHCYLIIASLHAFYAILQFFYGFDFFIQGQQSRPAGSYWHSQGLFSHHLTFGCIMLLSAPITWFLCTQEKLSPNIRILYTLAAVLISVAAITSLGRSIWLGLLFSGVAFLILFRKNTWVKLGLAVSVGGVFLIYLLFPGITKTFSTRFQAALSSPHGFGELERRANLWKAGLKVIQNHFIIGAGSVATQPMEAAFAEVEQEVIRQKLLENPTLSKFEDPVFLNTPSAGVHNWYLQLWAEQGVIGLLLYILIWGVLFMQSLKAIRLYKNSSMAASHFLKALWAAFLGFFVAGFFENNFLDDEVQIIVLIWIGFCLAICNKMAQPNNADTKNPPARFDL